MIFSAEKSQRSLTKGPMELANILRVLDLGN